MAARHCCRTLVADATPTTTLVPSDAQLLGGDGVITQGTQLANIDIPLDYEIGLDITPTTSLESGWGSIVHFTATGSNCCNYGDRIPGVWFWPNTRKLLVVDGHTDNGNSHTDEWGCDDSVLTLEPNVNYRLRMVFNLYSVSVYVNDQVACDNIPRVDRQVWPNTLVYVGDPWHAPAQASVQNLYFKPLGALFGRGSGGCSVRQGLVTRCPDI